MKLTTIAEAGEETDLAKAEADFNRACGLIESGDKKEAFEMFARLPKMRLPAELLHAELLHAARTASGIRPCVHWRSNKESYFSVREAMAGVYSLRRLLETIQQCVLQMPTRS